MHRQLGREGRGKKMSRRASFFVRLDGDWMEDEKIRQLRRKDGYEGLGVYLALLTLMIKYKDRAYQIPFSEIEIIAEEDIHIPSERLTEIINHAVEIGLLKVSSDITRFYSERRRNELLAAEKTREKQVKAALETNRKFGRLTDKSNVSV